MKRDSSGTASLPASRGAGLGESRVWSFYILERLLSAAGPAVGNDGLCRPPPAPQGRGNRSCGEDEFPGGYPGVLLRSTQANIRALLRGWAARQSFLTLFLSVDFRPRNGRFELVSETARHAFRTDYAQSQPCRVGLPGKSSWPTVQLGGDCTQCPG